MHKEEIELEMFKMDLTNVSSIEIKFRDKTWIIPSALFLSRIDEIFINPAMSKVSDD
jgi:hypothetical protein